MPLWKLTRQGAGVHTTCALSISCQSDRDPVVTPRAAPVELEESEGMDEASQRRAEKDPHHRVQEHDQQQRRAGVPARGRPRRSPLGPNDPSHGAVDAALTAVDGSR